jgi:hypothetical protein
MPIDQYRALVDEYYRDIQHAELRATIMNSSGRYTRNFSAKDLIPELDVAPPKSNDALRNALRILGKHPNA